MNLGELITALEAVDPNQVVSHGFHNPHSYRGDYYDLAFEPAQNVTVASMLEAARTALGTTYQGWKGGDFTMDADTWCWLSEQGTASCDNISSLLFKLMLSQPADRAAEWRAAAEHLEQRAAAIADNSDDPAIFVAKAREREAVGWKDAAAELRRVADEAQQAQSGCAHRGPHPGFTCGEVDASQPYFNVRWDTERQPETQGALLATRCDACRHTLNWHRNDVGCTVVLCVCSRFQQPAAVSQPDGEA